MMNMDVGKTNERDKNKNAQEEKKSSSSTKKIPGFTDSTETDIFLYRHIGRTQPPPVFSNPTEKSGLQNDMFNNQQGNVLEQDSAGTGIIQSNTNLKDSTWIAMPHSPMQEVPPCGSFDTKSHHEKMKVGNFELPSQNTTYSFQNPTGLQVNQKRKPSKPAHLQGLQFAAKHNTPSSSGVPPGYAAMNPAVGNLIPGLAQYPHPPSYIPVPTSQYHPISSNIQTYYHQMANNDLQYQQAQLSAPKSIYEQGNFASNISQIQMSHPQMVQQQTKPAMVTQNQHLMMSIPLDQSQTRLNVAARQEEIYQKMLRSLQQLNQLQEEYVQSQVQHFMQINQTSQPLVLEYPMYQLALRKQLVYPGIVQNQQLPIKKHW